MFIYYYLSIIYLLDAVKPDGVVNEACQPASVDFTFSGFFMSPEPAEALGEGFTIELTGAEVGVTGSSPSQDGAGYSVDFGFHATTLNQ